MASDAFKQKLLKQARAFHVDALKQSKKKKLQDYIRASSGDATHRQTVANYTETPDSKVAVRNAGQERAQQRLNKLGEDVSAVITNGEDRRKYNSLRSMQSDRLAKAKKSKDLVRASHEQMAQRHGDDAESILDKYRKESTDVCHVCGQTPCNCTHISEAHKIGDKVEIVKGSAKGIIGHIGEIRHGAYKGAPKTFTVFHGEKGATQVSKEHIKAVKEEVAVNNGGTCPALKEAALPKGSMVPGIPSKRETTIKLAMAKAGERPYQEAKVKYGVGYRQESTSNPYVLEGVVDEAKIPSGLTWTGSGLKKRPELVAAAARRKNYKAYLKRKAAKEQNTTKVDESSDKLYAGYQADVLSLKAKAKKQEQERGPVDIQKLAARLKAVKLKGTQK